jgi:hypothetical protein
MNCEFYNQNNRCIFASGVYGKPDSKLDEDQKDYISEFCNLRGISCRNKESLLNKLQKVTE